MNSQGFNSLARVLMAQMNQSAEPAPTSPPPWWEPSDPRAKAELYRSVCQQASREATAALPKFGHTCYCRKCGGNELRRVYRSLESQGCPDGCDEHFEHMLVACMGCGAMICKERPLDCRGER